MIFALVLFTIAFLSLTWRKFEWGVFVLFLLLPTYLIRFQIGPIPSTLLEVMLLSVCAVGVLKNPKVFWDSLKNSWQKNILLSVGIFIFLIGATINVFMAVEIKKALGEWRAFYVEPLLLFFVLRSFVQSLTREKKKEVIMHSLVLPLLICGFVTSILAVYQHFTGFMVPYSFWENRATYRVTAWYGFPNAVGLFLAPLIPLTIYWIAQNWNKKTEHMSRINLVFGVFSLITICLALLFAKGSGPMLGAAGGIGILILYHPKLRWPAIVMGLLSVLMVFTAPQLHSIKQEFLAQDYSGSLRRDIWNETIALLKDHPLVGSGMASYGDVIVPYRHNHKIEVFHHPHNLLLTLWVNTGILGLVGFVLVLLATLKNALKTKTQETKYFLSSLVVILIMGLVDSPYIKNDLAIVFWSILLLLLP